MNQNTDYGTLSARAAYAARLSGAPRATSARVEAGVLRVELATGAAVEVPTAKLGRLAQASDEQLTGVRLVANGTVLMWEDANVDLSVATVLERATGLFDAVAGGAVGGRARTEAKRVASRANGKKGGRPRKVPLEAA